MKDIIYIKDLRVQTIIGIFGWEREVRQEVSIDLEISFDCKKAAKTDSIEDTIDYKKITKSIIKFVEESSFQLQESLAEGIAKAHPLKRLGEGKDSASLAKFLISDDSSWVTGQVIAVDGGRSKLS